MNDDYKLRVIEEKRELDEKRTRLSEFLSTDKANNLSRQDRNMLILQGTLMTSYSIVLGQRIERFEALNV